MSYLDANKAYELATSYKANDLLDAALILIEEAASNGNFSLYAIDDKIIEVLKLADGIERPCWNILENSLKSLGYKITTHIADGYGAETKAISWRK